MDSWTSPVDGIRLTAPDSGITTIELSVIITICSSGSNQMSGQLVVPGSIDIATTRSPGLKLINFLAKHQMKAEISVNNNEKTEFTFRFSYGPVGRD
jgi:hypothetical protein